jgi:hypothetical protein
VRLERELAEARVLVRSEQNPDCVVLLRSALGWLRDGWTKEVAAERDALRADVARLREALKLVERFVYRECDDQAAVEAVSAALDETAPDRPATPPERPDGSSDPGYQT